MSLSVVHGSEPWNPIRKNEALPWERAGSVAEISCLCLEG